MLSYQAGITKHLLEKYGCKSNTYQFFNFSLQFISQQREIDDHKEEINRFKSEVSKLNGEKEKMKKDIQGLRKEIVERDDTIQDKVRLQANLLLIKCTK